MGKSKNIKDIYSLSPLQEGMLFHWLMDKKSLEYFSQMEFTLNGNIDIELMEKSLNKLIERYDILRTVFVYEKVKSPLQVVLKQRTLNIHFEDISGMPEEEKASYMEEFNRKDRAKGFDLSKDILIRMSVFKIGVEEYKLIWSFHHIIIDGWCIHIINKNFLQIYQGLKQGTVVKLAPAVPYRNYIQWLKKQDKKKGLNYWQDYLDGYEHQATLPKLGKPLPGNKNKYEPGEHHFIIDRDLNEGLLRIVKENQVTFNLVFQAIWGLLLQKYNNTNDVVFGTVVSGRSPEIEGIEHMMGLFINTIPVRIRIENPVNFSQLLLELKHRAALSKSYEYLPLAEVQTNSALKGNLIDHIMAFENFPTQQAGETTINSGFIPEFAIGSISGYEQTNYDFNLVVDIENPLKVRFIFNQSVYPLDLIKRISEDFKMVAAQVAIDPVIDVQAINIISAEEKKQLLFDFNNITPGNTATTDTAKYKTIYQLFAEEVEKIPNNTAVVYKDLYLTYRKLNRYANRLSRLLRSKGVKPNTIVGILAERSIEMMVGILGILKAGGAYLPIDPDYPEERINYMLADSEAKMLVTTPGLSEKFKKLSIVIYQLSIINCQREFASSAPGNSPVKPSHSTLASALTCQVSPTNLAYVIYTSGTTGKPKGTLATHWNVIRVVRDTNYIDLRPDDRLLQLSNYAFDGSVFDIYGALLNGAALVMISKEDIFAMNRLSQTIIREAITIFLITTALFNTLVDLNLRCLSQIRKILFGGERVSVEYSRKALEYLGKQKIIHMYGPTETTVYATYYFIDEITSMAGTIPIGKPISNTLVYILDKNMKLVPMGINGEIFIGGDGTSRGYLNQPELTAEKFVKQVTGTGDRCRWEKQLSFNKSFCGGSGGGFFKKSPLAVGDKIYKTGDLARWLPDGNIEFLGRIDHQLKIRGFRVEPGEIERLLLTHRHIKESVVTAKEDKKGEKYLCAYIVTGNELDVPRLKEYLSRKMPGYMIPSYFVKLDKLPLTPNGKINRKLLPDPHPDSLQKDLYEAPRSETEKKLVRICSEVLGIEENKFGINHDFFDLGGDSIGAIKLISRSSMEGIHIPLRDLLQYRTIKKLLENLVLKKNTTKIVPQEMRRKALLTPIQKWFFELDNVHANYHNVSILLKISDKIDLSILEKAFRKMIEYHDGLRINFIEENGTRKQYCQEIEEIDFSIEYITIAGKNKKERKDKELHEIDRIQGSLEIGKGLLLKVAVLNIGKSKRKLLFTVHHLIFDIVSIHIFFDDMSYLYGVYAEHKRNKSNGNEEIIINLPLKSTSMLEWSHKLYTGVTPGDIDINYWQGIASQPTDYLVDEKELKELPNFSGDASCFRTWLDKKNTQKLKTDVTRKYDVTIEEILLSTMVISLHHTMGLNTILIELESHGREPLFEEVDLTRSMGWFTNKAPILLAYKGDIESTISNTRKVVRGIANRGIHYSIARYILEMGNVPKIEGQITFNYSGDIARMDGNKNGDDKVKFENLLDSDNKMGELNLPIHPGNHYPFILSVLPGIENSKLYLSILYNNKYLKPGIIKNFCHNYISTLKQMAKPKPKLLFFPGFYPGEVHVNRLAGVRI